MTGPAVVVVGVVAVCAAVTLAAVDNPPEQAPADTAPAAPASSSTVWQTTNLPPPLTPTPSVHATRGSAHQLTQPPAPPTTNAPLPPHYDIWLRLAECESGSNWQINTGNGFYGGLQFTLQSWRGAGGLKWAARPDWATPLGQMWTAETLLGMQGWGAWPGCARKLGLR